MKPLNMHSHNRAAWDRLAREHDRLAKPARDEDFANPLKSVDGPGWLGSDISQKNVLCLAAGGGRQGPIYAAAGAHVTVVDISSVMLERDKVVAAKRNLNIRTIEASMDDLSMLGDATFEIVIHPVSTCYVPDVVPVYREVARVLCDGGIYISQHKQPTSLQTGLETINGTYPIRYPYFSKDPLPSEPTRNLVRESGTQEFVHRWEELLGAMCRAGLVIEDLTEPVHAKRGAACDTFAHRSQYVAPYVRVKSRRVNRSPGSQAGMVWLPTSL